MEGSTSSGQNYSTAATESGDVLQRQFSRSPASIDAGGGDHVGGGLAERGGDRLERVQQLLATLQEHAADQPFEGCQVADVLARVSESHPHDRRRYLRRWPERTWRKRQDALDVCQQRNLNRQGAV